MGQVSPLNLSELRIFEKEICESINLQLFGEKRNVATHALKSCTYVEMLRNRIVINEMLSILNSKLEHIMCNVFRRLLHYQTIDYMLNRFVL